MAWADDFFVMQLSISKQLNPEQPTQVWYAGYGSNLLRSRFLCYIQGGAPTEHHQPHIGCRDNAEPLEDRILSCPYPVVYAGQSSSWGTGGVAFLDINDELTVSPLRLWRITREQFEDVCAMENAQLPGAIQIDWISLLSNGTAIVANFGWYRQAVYLGEIDGAPVVTFTWPEPRQDLSPPSERYAQVIADGLRECGWT